MQQQERDLIADLFGRLQQFENQPRDAEAERLIASYIARQPAAPYLLTQTVLVQEEALKQARTRIAELEAGRPSENTSFLGSAPKIGPWGSAPRQEQQQVPVPQSARPWGGPPVQQPQQAAGGAGGGFLRSALATAAGVAGGALLFEGIRNMFGHSTQAFAQPMLDSSSLMPPDVLPSPDQDPGYQDAGDPGQDMSAGDDYDTTSDDSGFDDSNSDI